LHGFADHFLHVAAGDYLSVNDLLRQQPVSGNASGDTVFLYGVNLGLQASW
jgi:hypothetical protein